MNEIKDVFRFEDVRFDYINDQIEGLFKELNNKYQDEGYISEKLNNAINFFNEVMDNFKDRIKDKEVRQTLKIFLEKRTEEQI